MDSGSNTSDTQAVGTANGGSSGSLRQAAQAKTSRRSMLRRGGIVAAGTVAGLTLLDQRRAQAADGASLILGSTGNSATHTTELSVTPAGQTVVPLFRVNGSGCSGTSTTMIVDGPGAVQGRALVVNGNAGGTGIITSAATTSGGTVGLALAASGTNGADAIHASSDKGKGITASGKRGGVFAGSAAAVQLTPHSGTHPTHGQKGDLFVDHNAHLFFCRGGSTWVKLA